MSVKIGDKIRITNAYYSFGDYENGDVLTVGSFYDKGKVRVKELPDAPWIGEDEFEVIREIQKGDIVTGRTVFTGPSEYRVGEVEDIGTDGLYGVRSITDDVWYHGVVDVKLVAKAEDRRDLA